MITRAIDGIFIVGLFVYVLSQAIADVASCLAATHPGVQCQREPS